jgi:hypothetical protein
MLDATTACVEGLIGRVPARPLVGAATTALAQVDRGNRLRPVSDALVSVAGVPRSPPVSAAGVSWTAVVRPAAASSSAVRR